MRNDVRYYTHRLVCGGPINSMIHTHWMQSRLRIIPVEGLDGNLTNEAIILSKVEQYHRLTFWKFLFEFCEICCLLLADVVMGYQDFHFLDQALVNASVLATLVSKLLRSTVVHCLNVIRSPSS